MGDAARLTRGSAKSPKHEAEKRSKRGSQGATKVHSGNGQHRGETCAMWNS